MDGDRRIPCGGSLGCLPGLLLSGFGFFCRLAISMLLLPRLRARARTIIQFQPCFDGLATMMASKLLQKMH